MSLAITIQGEALDLEATQSAELVLSSPMPFAPGETLPGSYSLPFEALLTPRNRRMLRFPEQLDGASPMATDLPALLSIAGNTQPALLSVQSADPRRAQIYLLFDALGSLKEVPLRELDLGGERVLSTAIAESAVDNYLSTDPAVRSDWVLFPVAGMPRGLDVVSLSPALDPVANRLDSVGRFASVGPAAVYPRIDYLLGRIAARIGYTLVNRWQVTPELRGLVLWNSRLLFEQELDFAQGNEPGVSDAENVWGKVFDLRHHVPGLDLRHVPQGDRQCLQPGHRPKPRRPHDHHTAGGVLAERRRSELERLRRCGLQRQHRGRRPPQHSLPRYRRQIRRARILRRAARDP